MGTLRHAAHAAILSLGLLFAGCASTAPRRPTDIDVEHGAHIVQMADKNTVCVVRDSRWLGIKHYSYHAAQPIHPELIPDRKPDFETDEGEKVWTLEEGSVVYSQFDPEKSDYITIMVGNKPVNFLVLADRSEPHSHSMDNANNVLRKLGL